MFSPTITLISLSLVAASAILIAAHVRSWRELRFGGDPESPELQFAWRQTRRRVQASGMLGIVGVAMALGQLITTPLLWGCVWLGIVILLFWIVLLAMGDALATGQHYGQHRQRNMAEQARLQAEIRRHHAAGSNGASPEEDPSVG